MGLFQYVMAAWEPIKRNEPFSVIPPTTMLNTLATGYSTFHVRVV
jgi:hypothetical protein